MELILIESGVMIRNQGSVLYRLLPLRDFAIRIKDKAGCGQCPLDQKHTPISTCTISTQCTIKIMKNNMPRVLSDRA